MQPQGLVSREAAAGAKWIAAFLWPLRSKLAAGWLVWPLRSKLAAGWLVFLLAASGAGAEPPASAPQPLPATTFTQPGGGAYTLAGLKGRPALINFWGTWCPPCREELPLLIKAHGRYGKQVAFVGLAVEDNAEFMGEFARAYKVPYPVAAGREAAIALMQALGNGKALMPFTVILDAEGRTVFSRAGIVSEKELERALEPLLQSRSR